MNDIDALLAKVDFQIQSQKTDDYIEPEMYRWYGEILVPTGSRYGNRSYQSMDHLYEDESWNPQDFGEVVIHGHKANMSCFRPCFCHLYGYWPVDENSPRFKRQFEKKWKKLYEERGWNR